MRFDWVPTRISVYWDDGRPLVVSALVASKNGTQVAIHPSLTDCRLWTVTYVKFGRAIVVNLKFAYAKALAERLLRGLRTLDTVTPLNAHQFGEWLGRCRREARQKVNKDKEHDD